MEFETQAIHAGQEPDPLTGSVNVPIYQTSTYAQDGVLQMRGGFVHGTAGLSAPIAEDLWLVGPQAVERPIRLGLSNSFGFGSIATSVAVRRMIEGA